MDTSSRLRRSLFWMLLCGLVCGCQPTAVEELPPPRVTVAHPVQRDLVDEDEYNGWMQASQTVDLRAQVRGHIQKIDFQDGDEVRQGQPLIELDPRPFRSAIDECLAQAKALEAKKIAADKNVVRTTELLKRNAISAQEQEQTVADALALDAEWKAKLQQAATHKLDLEYSRIVAPISGRISRALLTEGNLVNAGGSDPVLTTIVCIDPMYIYFNVDERACSAT